MDDIGFGWLGIYGLLFKTLAFAVAAFSVMMFSIYLDHRLGVPFKQAFTRALGTDQHGIYYAARWAGLCLLAGAIYG